MRQWEGCDDRRRSAANEGSSCASTTPHRRVRRLWRIVGHGHRASCPACQSSGRHEPGTDQTLAEYADRDAVALQRQVVSWAASGARPRPLARFRQIGEWRNRHETKKEQGMLEQRELSMEELEAERGAELPDREALTLFTINVSPSFNIAPVTAVNGALALNAATIGSNAAAWAGQIVGVGQVIH